MVNLNIKYEFFAYPMYHTMSFDIFDSYYYIFLGEFVIKHQMRTRRTINEIKVSCSMECWMGNSKPLVMISHTSVYATIEGCYDWHIVRLDKARADLVKWRTTAKLRSRRLARSDLDRIHNAIDGLMW